MTPKISVIIPVYNGQKHLKQCMDSVLTQTIDGLEIICIDDGSTDDSVEIINTYIHDNIATNVVIMLLVQQNLGAGVARNRGIKKASGEFVSFMDCDDYYPDNNVLKDLYQSAKDNHVAVSGGSFCEDREGVYLYSFDKLGEKQTFDKDGIMSYQAYQYDYGFYRFIYERQLLTGNDIFFPDYRRYQDPPFMVRALKCADKFYAMKRVSYVYRLNMNGIFWNEEKRGGLLDGMSDVVRQAKMSDLVELKELTFERVFDEQKEILKSVFEKRESLNLIKLNGLSVEADPRNAKQIEMINHFYFDIYDERDRLIADKNRLEAESAELRDLLDSVYKSKSYRLGTLILKPFILIRRLFQKQARR